VPRVGAVGCWLATSSRPAAAPEPCDKFMVMNLDLTSKSLLVMPLLSSVQRIPPNKPTRFTNRPSHGAFDLSRIIIGERGTGGGAANWIVNDLEIDGRSQLSQKDLPGALFSGLRGVATGRGSTELMLSGFDTVERGSELALIVTYVGSHPEGAPFIGTALGSRPPQRPTVVAFTTVTELPSMTATTISLRVENAPFQVSRLVIDDAGTPDGAAAWIVNDIRVNGKSQFAQTGDVPGDVFSANMIDSFLSIETCPAGGLIEFIVTYIGFDAGAVFTGRLEGTVVRDDRDMPPPDLQVLVGVDGKSSGSVVGTCDWRPPATSDSVP